MEMSQVAEAMFTAFAPRKLNYEALGNSVPHLHWWLTPRYDNDARPRGPIWEDLDFLRHLWTNGARPDDTERDLLKRTLLDALDGSTVVSRSSGGSSEGSRQVKSPKARRISFSTE